MIALELKPKPLPELSNIDTQSLFSDVALYVGFPARPDHRCKGSNREGAVIIVYEDETAVARMTTPAWRDTEKYPQCPACYHDRVVRHCQQIKQEQQRGSLYWAILPNEQKSKEINRLRKQRERQEIDFVYRAYPLGNGEHVLISNRVDGHELPSDNAQLYELVKQWAHTPEGARVSSSEGWGGDFQGAKGDGRKTRERKKGIRRKCVQLWTTANIHEVADRLDYKLAAIQEAFTKEIDAAYAAIALKGLELYQKRTNKPGTDALLDFFFPENEQTVTTCEYIAEPEDMCLSRDIEKGIGEEKKIFEPLPFMVPLDSLLPKPVKGAYR